MAENVQLLKFNFKKTVLEDPLYCKNITDKLRSLYTKSALNLDLPAHAVEFPPTNP